MKRAAEQVRALALRLGKGPVKVEVECERIRAERSDWHGLWLELPHVLRNAVDHGLESVEERRALGKAREATIRLRAYSTQEGLVVEVEDAGRGIEWERVRAKARSLGLIGDGASNQAALVEALFSFGLTTRDSASEISGRGVGLAAIRDVVRQRGGRVSVESRRGQGTKFSFLWPTPTLFSHERSSLLPTNSSTKEPSS
jgi:chemotaxis protein histidine kinase CheA